MRETPFGAPKNNSSGVSAINETKTGTMLIISSFRDALERKLGIELIGPEDEGLIAELRKCSGLFSKFGTYGFNIPEQELIMYVDETGIDIVKQQLKFISEDRFGKIIETVLPARGSEYVQNIFSTYNSYIVSKDGKLTILNIRDFVLHEGRYDFMFNLNGAGFLAIDIQNDNAFFIDGNGNRISKQYRVSEIDKDSIYVLYSSENKDNANLNESLEHHLEEYFSDYLKFLNMIDLNKSEYHPGGLIGEKEFLSYMELQNKHIDYRSLEDYFLYRDEMFGFYTIEGQLDHRDIVAVFNKKIMKINEDEQTSFEFGIGYESKPDYFLNIYKNLILNIKQ